MVVDTSILLSIIFNEKNASWASDQLQHNILSLRMSTVNFCEVLILSKSKQPQRYSAIKEYLDRMPIRMVPPNATHAEIAAMARLEFPLNLGDCFAYALAKAEGCQILTLDEDFKKTDLEILIP